MFSNPLGEDCLAVNFQSTLIRAVLMGNNYLTLLCRDYLTVSLHESENILITWVNRQENILYKFMVNLNGLQNTFTINLTI